MPVTYDFSLTADQIGTAALKKINAISLGDTPTAAQLTDTRQILNLLCKELVGENISLFTTERYTKALVGAATSFTLDAKYIDILSADLTQDGHDIPIEIITKKAYYAIEDKDAADVPQKIMVDFTSSVPTVYVYPVPPSTYNLNLNLLRLIADFDSGADIPGMPVKWQKYLVYEVAAYMADDYGLPQGDKDRLKLEAEKLRIRAMASNYERTGAMRIKPCVPVL